jgi:hypothetical protein
VATVGEEDFPAGFCGCVWGLGLSAEADLACEVVESVAAELLNEVEIAVGYAGRVWCGWQRRNGGFVGAGEGEQELEEERGEHRSSLAK